jgi:phosphate butyryltransferase
MNKNFILFCLLSYFILTTTTNSLSFDEIIEKAKNLGKMKKVAVAGGDNLTMLQACRKAKDLKIADCVLFGVSKKIKDMASSNNLDISDFEIIEEPIDSQCAMNAAEYVREGKADIYAKGSLETKYTLKAILDNRRGLRKSRIVSGITILEAKKYNKLLIFTDAHVRPYPTINEKMALIDNAVEFAHSIGIENPKVAAVCALEKVNHIMRETEEAMRLSKMNDIGQIRGCIVDGPLSFDLAINPKTPKYKGMEKRKIKGDADIILFPNIHSANLAYNLMIHAIKAKHATLLSGTTAPCVFTSRSGDLDSKFNSIILAIFYSEFLQDKKTE